MQQSLQEILLFNLSVTAILRRSIITDICKKKGLNSINMPGIEEPKEIRQDSSFINRYKDGSYSDREDPEERASLFEFIFGQEIFKPNGFLDREAVKGKVLDLGSGKGALGIYLKRINPEIEIVGTDLIDYSNQGFISYPYNQTVKTEAVSFLQEVQTSVAKFDLVISCGFPFETIEEMLKKIDFGKVLNQDGYALFLVDYPLNQETGTLAKDKGFGLKSGNYPIDQSILVYQKK